jgi:hypothetical protein
LPHGQKTACGPSFRGEVTGPSQHPIFNRGMEQSGSSSGS